MEEVETPFNSIVWIPRRLRSATGGLTPSELSIPLYGFMGMMKSGRTTIDVLAFNSIVWIRLGKTLWVVAVSGFLSIPLYGFYSDVLSRRGETVPSAFNSIVWILLATLDLCYKLFKC
jgi:hypothetical protein